MESFNLGRYSNSLPSSPCVKILSPSPLKKAADKKIGNHVAKQLFSAVSEEVETDNFITSQDSPSNFMKAKFLSLKVENDSSNSEWSSDSGLSNSSNNQEFELETSLIRKTSTRNPFNQDQIFEDLAFEIPCRTSNPIANELNYRCSQTPDITHSTRVVFSSKMTRKIPDFY